MCNIKKINVLFLPDWRSGNPYQDLLIEGLKEHRVTVVMANYETGLLGLFRTSRKYKNCSIIHMHWIGPYIEWLYWSKSKFKTILKLCSYFLDLILIRLSGKKLIWTIHNTFVHEQKNIKLELIIRKWIFLFSNKIIVHSNSAVNLIKKEYSLINTGKFTVIPHGHYISEYENTISKDEARQILGIDKYKKVFLYFGMIRPYKGISNLINVFRSVDGLKDAILVIAGKPYNSGFMNDLKTLIGEETNIKFFPEFIPDDNIQIYMNASDIVVLPFEKILTSGSVILAMSFKKPVIVPEKGGLSDLVEDGILLFNDRISLKERLEQALTLDLESLGETNFKIALSLDWNKICGLIKNVYV